MSKRLEFDIQFFAARLDGGLRAGTHKEEYFCPSRLGRVQSFRILQVKIPHETNVR